MDYKSPKSTEPKYCDENFPFLLNDPASSNIATQRKASQETVRPRLNRAATMPSAQCYNHSMLPDAVYYPAYQVFHNTATAPTSPGASSTTGSHLSSSADEHDYTQIYLPTVPTQSKPVMLKTRKVAKSEGEEDASQKIARPPNAWILYRSKKLAEFKQSNPKMYVGKNIIRNKADRGVRPTQASFSKQIANMWAAETAEVKEAYHEEASLRSVMHAIENPGYRFNPNKKRTVSEKTKIKRERTKSSSPTHHTGAFPRTTAGPINATPSPGMLSTFFPSPVLEHSPAGSQHQQSPWRQSDYQWSLSPPAANTVTFSASQGSPSPLESRYAQERRPSLKAQWDAIFPNEGQDGSLSASSCSTSFSSNYTGAGSVSPLWGSGLLPSLSIDEPIYSNTAPFVPSALSSGFVDATVSQSSTPAASTAATSPVQFAFAPPTLALPNDSEYSFWPSGQQSQGFVGLQGMGLDLMGTTASSPAFSATATTPLEQQLSSTDLIIPVPQSAAQPSFSVSSGDSPMDPAVITPTEISAVQVGQPPLNDAAWWSFRHLKVKQDDVDGIPLEDLLKSLGNPASM